MPDFSGRTTWADRRRAPTAPWAGIERRRRGSSMNGTNGERVPLPPWLRTLLYAVRELGVSTVVAFILLGVLIGKIPSPMLLIPSIESRLDTIEKTLLDHDRDMDKFRDTLGYQTRLFRLICQHTAKIESDRAACDREPVGGPP